MRFGSSGIRAPYNREMIGFALRVGAALAGKSGRVLVGTDTRHTGPLLAAALMSGLLSGGASVEHCGIAPTPAVAYEVRHRDSAVVVTASHNPEPDNGFKFFNPDGSSFTHTQQKEIESHWSDPRYTGWLGQGDIHQCDVIRPYHDSITGSLSIQGRVKVIVDCGNGAGSLVTPDLLLSLGADTIAVNADPAGVFARPSEPLPPALFYLPGLIRSKGADCAVFHDGDADRMAACDRRGRFIDGDRLMILFTRYLDAHKVVTTVDASMAIEEYAEVRRTPVGDSYVSEALRSWGDFGGEPSGAWIFPRHSYCPDGPYAAALLCEIASEWDLEEELDAIPGYPVRRESVAVPDPDSMLIALGAETPTDGVRITRDDGWCLIRASGTEPKIRITAEGRDTKAADRMLEEGRNLFRDAGKRSGGEAR